MDMVTYSLCAAMMSIGKRSNEEIISPFVAQMIGGPNKRMRKSTKKAIEAAHESNVKDFIQEATNIGKDISKETKELV